MDKEGARVAGYGQGRGWARMGLSYQTPEQVRASVEPALADSRDYRPESEQAEVTQEYENAFRRGVEDQLTAGKD